MSQEPFEVSELDLDDSLDPFLDGQVDPLADMLINTDNPVQFAFAPTQTPNGYRVVDFKWTLGGGEPLKDYVTFRNHTPGGRDDDPAILPDPELLRVHHIIGQIIHVCGLQDVLPKDTPVSCGCGCF
ncbi:hypothetical protein DL546_002457 [Coniochaeta pulveracea]|uniref:Uncharacterized protein n=1 Tax=Coniochaeta pulveracea TaxID=177199 RepID=A0A420YME7_9PEZI|nr:hypothetical protein DL546_002457 [Coniochaeta pulveracea]